MIHKFMAHSARGGELALIVVGTTIALPFTLPLALIGYIAKKCGYKSCSDLNLELLDIQMAHQDSVAQKTAEKIKERNKNEHGQ